MKAGASPKIIVTFALIGILGIGLNLVFMATIRKAQGIDPTVTAKSLAQQVIETMKINGYAKVFSNSDIAHGQFVRMWVVDTDSMQKNVDVIVTWPRLKPCYLLRVHGVIPFVKPGAASDKPVMPPHSRQSSSPRRMPRF